MHINHTHPQFGDAFFERFTEMQKLWQTHPVLSLKQSIISSLNANDLVSLQQKVSELVHVIESKEKPLLQNITFSLAGDARFSTLVTDSTLDAQQKNFVKKHQSIVSATCNNSFKRLIEYAVISDTKHYSTVHNDYANFQFAVDGLRQVKKIHDHLGSQMYLAQKIQSKIKSRPHLLADDVTTLQESHESQLGLMARLPQFSFR